LNRESSSTPRSWRVAADSAAAFVLRWEIVFLILISPLFFFPPLGRGVLTAIALLPVVWLSTAATGRQAIPITPFNGPIALMVIMVLVSLWATYDIFFSAGKVLGVVLGIAFYFAIVRRLTTRPAFGVALNLFVLAAVALALIGLLGTNWIGKVAFLGSVTSRLPAVIRGVPGQAAGFQPNAIAGALVMFIPLQIALARVKSGVQRNLHLVALFFTGATVLLTQSRNGWLSLAAALLAWALWGSKRSRHLALAAVVVAAVVGAMFLGRIESIAGSGIKDDIAGRVELWSRAIYGIQDFPITGMGMNTFRRVMPVFYPTFLSSPDVDVAHAHNHLLQAALDLGLPGLIAYLAIWIGVAHLLTRVQRRSTDRAQRLVAGGLAAGMLAYFIFGTADTIALGAKLGIFFWIALALIVALHRTDECSGDRPRPPAGETPAGTQQVQTS
jgi:putative inorganic carbon (hco3(-)) transporter